MATFNGARFLVEQLESLARQSTLPFELIVSDDGSVDATTVIIEQFSQTAPFPVIFRRNQHRMGYGANFLHAAALASGDFIAFCDQDDVWHPDKLRTSVDRLSQSDAYLYVHTAMAIDELGRPLVAFSQGITRYTVYEALELGPWSVFYGCTMTFPRRLLTLLDPSLRGRHTFEHVGLLSHDLWIYFLATSLGRVVVESRPLIEYRQHEANVTPSIMSRGFRAWIRSLGIAADPKLLRGDIARGRSALLQGLGGTASDPAVGQAARRAAKYWDKVAHFEDARIEIYLAKRLTERLPRFSKLAWSGGYRAFRKGGLGAKLLLKDLLVGVFRGRGVNGVLRKSRLASG